MLWSRETGGFYSPDIHGGNIPFDAVEITDDLYFALLEGQSAGRQIAPGNDGFPVLVDPPPLTLAQIQAQRQAAYARESDPLKNEAEYDALVGGAPPDYAAWLAKVAEIKERYPLPAAE